MLTLLNSKIQFTEVFEMSSVFGEMIRNAGLLLFHATRNLI